MTPSLSRLERVDVRSVWANEATAFTPWLSQADNLALLGDALGLELEFEAREREVGPFRADLLCKDGDGHFVLIENQLQKTDHPHLGQLMAYAAGLQAVTIVWIATKFVEEHRAALDWLNEITDRRFQFFGVEVELWKIGDSEPAPKFNLVSKPNAWSKSVSEAARKIETGEMSETKLLQLKFWTELNDFLITEKSTVRSQQPRAQHWSVFRIGRSGFGLSGTLNTTNNRLGCELFLSDEDAKAYFQLLEQDRQRIDEELGFKPEWMPLPDKKACRILFTRSVSDVLDERQWADYRQWFKTTLERFDKVFRPRVRALNLEAPLA